MNPRSQKLIHAMMVLMLVLAPLQSSGAALHMDCAASEGGMMAAVDGGGTAQATAADLMSAADHGQGDCLGMSHGCVSCISCFAPSAFPVAAVYRGEALRPMREHRPDTPYPAPAYRPPIALQS